LALSIFRNGNCSVVFKLVGERSLVFNRDDYITKFGLELGLSLYKHIAEKLKACRDLSITTETIRMGICTVIWNQFGTEWVDIFESIQESRKTTLPQGVDDLAVLLPTCVHIMNICFGPFV
jgi:hypothetical protein